MPGTDSTPEEHDALYNIVKAITRSAQPKSQISILCKHLDEAGETKAAESLVSLAEKATSNLSYGKTFLNLIDFPGLAQTLGREKLEKLATHLQGQDKYRRLHEMFAAVRGLKSDQVQVVKAKVAVMFQLLYLLRDRLEEEAMPQTTYDAVSAVLDQVGSTADEESGHFLRVDLNRFGKGYWHIFVNILKEADFRQVPEADVYEMVLSDAAIKQYASGSGLVSTEAGDSQTRVADAVISRMGENIVKRLSLLARTVSMYPADHPGIASALESLIQGIENLLQDRESITLSRVGTDLVVEDIRIKKKAKFLADFAEELDGRNVNSITFKRGMSVEEMRAFVYIFAENYQQIRKKGGVKAILDRKGVAHILVDQFKYGIIADDGTPADSISPDEKTLENVIFTEIITRIRDGQGLGDMSSEEIGSAFKSLLSGKLKDDPSIRRSMAQMIVSLDPDLMDRAIFEKGIIRDELSWSSARKMVDQLLLEAEKGDADVRQSALENLGKLAEVAVARNKETTLTLIIEKLSERLWAREKDIDVATRICDVLSDLTRHLILQEKLTQSFNIIKLFTRLRDYYENLPGEKQTLYSKAICELAESSIGQISNESTVGALMREVEGGDPKNQDLAARILETLRTREVVEQAFGLFLNASRSVRNRAFSLMTNLGRISLFACVQKLGNLNDAEVFPRDPNSGFLSDEGWYISRNSIDLVAKLGGPGEAEQLKEICEDRDPRIRREALVAISKLDPKEGVYLARLMLSDQESEVVENAIHTLGNLQAKDYVSEIIELFFVEEEYRSAVIASLSKIGGPAAEELLMEALQFRGGTPAVKIFKEQARLRLGAVKALGAVGTQRGEKALSRFLGRWSNPVTRMLFFPLKSVFKSEEMIKATKDSLARVRYRMRSRR